jgi:hypothetical protein
MTCTIGYYRTHGLKWQVIGWFEGGEKTVEEACGYANPYEPQNNSPLFIFLIPCFGKTGFLPSPQIAMTRFHRRILTKPKPI